MFQKLIVAGNLGRDPELRYLPNGRPVCNFSVATNRRWTNQDGSPGEETTWFQVSAFGRLAEVCNDHLAKGRQVLVEGRLRPDGDGNPRTWEGDDGEARASYDVVAQTVRFLGKKEGGETVEAPEEEIPF
jgi:single-strand DNA-binding protein